jgi:hypothetical protein
MKKRKIALRYLLFALVGLSLTNCNSNLDRVSQDKFIGTWEIKGRSMLNGIKISISKNESGEFKGRIVELNDNKYVKLFADSSDIWVTNIKRSSNFQFRLTEKKIGSQLFSLYGLDTKIEFKAEFIDDNTIGLETGTAAPLKSSVVYSRIK